jgi:hypothetical protein
MEVSNIITGHFNELFGLNKNISDERLKICKRCPLYSSKFGGLCNNKLYIDPNTGKISIEKRDGYVRGCGCRLQAKTTILHEKCVAGKW